MARTLSGRVFAALLSCLCLLVPVSAHARQFHMHSRSGTGAKAALTTRWDDGFILLLDGTRKDGEIQIKVIGDVDTVEVRFRTNGKADDKVVYKHGELRGFGLLEELASELKVSKNPLQNLQPGYVVLIDGSRVEGKVASTSDWLGRTVKLADANDKVSELTPAQVKLFGMKVGDHDYVFETYAGAFFQRYADGALVLIRNPHPTTHRTGMMVGIVQSLQDTLSKAAAEKQFKNEMKDVDKSDWTATMNKGIEAGQRAAETQQQIATADLSGFEKEYLLRPGSADPTAYIAINKDKCDDVLKRVFTGCAAYDALDKKQQRELLRWDAIEQSVGWYNSNCGK